MGLHGGVRMKRVHCTLLVLVALLGACRSTADESIEPAPTPGELREAWVQSLLERDLHPATVAFVGSLWHRHPSIDGLAETDALPTDIRIESVQLSDPYGFLCDAYAYTVHVDPIGGRYWITRHSGIRSSTTHFGPGELPEDETPPLDLRSNLFADLSGGSVRDDR